jgi:hypothetical protein
MPPKPQAESVGVDLCAARHGGGQAAIRIVRARGQPLFGLALAVLTQRGHGSRVECDSAPAAGRLRLAGYHLVPVPPPCPADAHDAAIQVDVLPRKAQQLAAAHAGGGGEQPGGEEPVIGDCGQECPRLLG